VPPNLSKSRFVAGWQCHKLLWLRVHEAHAPELQVDVVLQDRFDQGAEVGALAREHFPGGVLIDLPHNDPDRVEATRRALQLGASAVFEATFIEERVYVAIDVTRTDAWWRASRSPGSCLWRTRSVTATSCAGTCLPTANGTRGRWCACWIG
jgi:hypothetical protein